MKGCCISSYCSNIRSFFSHHLPIFSDLSWECCGVGTPVAQHSTHPIHAIDTTHNTNNNSSKSKQLKSNTNCRLERSHVPTTGLKKHTIQWKGVSSWSSFLSLAFTAALHGHVKLLSFSLKIRRSSQTMPKFNTEFQLIQLLLLVLAVGEGGWVLGSGRSLVVNYYFF